MYQKKDSELLKIEQEIAGSDERKKYMQTKSFLNKASEKLDKLESQSQAIVAQLEALKSRYAELNETLKDFEHLDELVESGADLSFYQRNLSQIIDKIKALKSEISALTATAKEGVDEYQNMKKKVIAAQKQYPEQHAAYQEFKKSKQDEADKISAELSALSKDIDPEVLRRYQAKRSERIFPIICEIKADRCSKCGIELSIVDKEKIAAGKVVECENCHRILYGA